LTIAGGLCFQKRDDIHEDLRWVPEGLGLFQNVDQKKLKEGEIESSSQKKLSDKS